MRVARLHRVIARFYEQATASRALEVLTTRAISMPLDAGQAGGISAASGGRWPESSGQVAGYRLVAASDGCRTRTVICMRSLKPSFS